LAQVLPGPAMLLALDEPFIIMVMVPVVMAIATAMTLITIISIGEIVVQVFLPRSNGDAPPGHFRLFMRGGSIIVIAHRSSSAIFQHEGTGLPTDSFGALIVAFTKT
jgi:hypothetical protein